jgi:hypothetical protein
MHSPWPADTSFWRVVLSTGRSYSQRDTIDDPTRGKRPLDWHLDIKATGDNARITELWLHTPTGDVALKITEPYTAYIFNVGVMSAEGRSAVAQVIGRVDNRGTGLGVAFVWDVAMQRVYKDAQADIRAFAAWRPGIIAPGALSADALGVKLS